MRIVFLFLYVRARIGAGLRLRPRLCCGLGAGMLALVAGCAELGYRDAIVDLAAFQPLAGHPQIRYAPGAEAYAARVAKLLPAAILHVEAAHYRPFQEPPVVYICNDDACFRRFVPAHLNFSAAVVYDNRLLLGAQLFGRETERLEPLLRHELSHLHLGQSRGHYAMTIPIWFHEGLASLVAEGGGADLATDSDAWDAATHARHFLPDEQHRPWTRAMAQAYGLSIHVFYRQSLLYLRTLRARDPDAFRTLLVLLQDGVEFDAAFAQAYQVNPARSALAFFRRLHCTEASAHAHECAPYAEAGRAITAGGTRGDRAAEAGAPPQP